MKHSCLLSISTFALLVTPLGCEGQLALPEGDLERVEQAESYTPTPNDPWNNGSGGLAVPRYIQLPHVLLPVGSMCKAPGPLSILTTQQDTTSGYFNEVAIPRAEWPELRRLPGQDMHWEQSSTTYEVVPATTEGYCRWERIHRKDAYVRRAWVWAQTYDVYNHNVALETWYDIVDAWGEAGKDLAVDYAKTGVWQDLGVISEAEGLIIDGAFYIDGQLNPSGEEDTTPEVLDVLDKIDKGLTVAELCSETFKAAKVTDEIKAIKLGVMTWGLTIKAATFVQERLGLLPESEQYEGARDYLFAVAFEEVEQSTPYLSFSWSEPFPCDGPRPPMTSADPAPDADASLDDRDSTSSEGERSGSTELQSVDRGE